MMRVYLVSGERDKTILVQLKKKSKSALHALHFFGSVIQLRIRIFLLFFDAFRKPASFS